MACPRTKLALVLGFSKLSGKGLAQPNQVRQTLKVTDDTYEGDPRNIHVFL